MDTNPKHIVVIGASAGGLNALAEMVKSFQKGLDTSYCIVLHLSRKSVGDFVVRRLRQATDMDCKIVVHDSPIEKDTIYIARPNQHMLVKDHKFLLGAGPEENRYRPSIDVLFRSAAVAYSSNTIGVILTGLLDDGTSGMSAINRCEGTLIVQDPKQAEYPDMPLSVINNMKVDHIVPVAEIGKTIAEVLNNKKGRKKAVPPDVIAESRIAEQTAVGIDDVRKLDVVQSIFACPDCGGGLWEVQHDVNKRYRCHIGHAYTENDLVLKQAQIAGTTLWAALRMMEERKHLLKKMEIESTRKGLKTLAENNVEKQAEMARHIKQLKEILFDLQNHDTA